MADHVWSVFCSRAIVDRGNNQVTLVDAIEGVNAQPRQPIPETKGTPVPLNGYLVTLWMRSDPQKGESLRFRIYVRTPAGKKHFQPGMAKEGRELDLKAHRAHRVFVKVESIPYFGSGRYAFVVETKHGNRWREVARVPYDLEVIQPKPPRKKSSTA